MVSRPLTHLACVLLVLAGSVACKEESGIEVTSLTFTGNTAVTSGQLKSVLATAPNDTLLGVALPWGTKRYFSREQFEADLKRIVAFDKDRGYPDARVASFDAKLAADQESVSVAIAISEGEPVRVEGIVLEGVEPLPAEHVRELKMRLPLKAGAPLDRALLLATRETVLDELRDHGYPYATVRLGENAGSSERRRVILLRADPGPIARYGPIEISGNSSVSDNVPPTKRCARPPRRRRRAARSHRSC